MKLFITGATGLIGQAITKVALARGDEVVALSRRARDPGAAATAAGPRWVQGDPATPGPWTAALAGCDAVVHLAGEPLGERRWNDERKALIRASRVDGTRGVVAAIAAVPEAARPKVLAVANGIDIYAFDDSDRPYAEDAPAGDGFLAELCVVWQREAEAAEGHGVRVVTMRTGIALDRDGGAFPRLLTPFKMFVGGRIGSGRQWFSWVHLADVARAYLFALDHASVRGPVNLVAPEPVRASELARAIGQALHRPSWFPVPRFALKLAAGELAEYLAEGRKVVPDALLRAGFAFTHARLDTALAQLVGKGEAA